LDGGWARRKDATYIQNKRTQTSMPLVGFEPTIPAFKRAKTVHALDRAATANTLPVKTQTPSTSPRCKQVEWSRFILGKLMLKIFPEKFLNFEVHYHIHTDILLKPVTTFQFR
jgi:hypothetical protein